MNSESYAQFIRPPVMGVRALTDWIGSAQCRALERGAVPGCRCEKRWIDAGGAGTRGPLDPGSNKSAPESRDRPASRWFCSRWLASCVHYPSRHIRAGRQHSALLDARLEHRGRARAVRSRDSRRIDETHAGLSTYLERMRTAATFCHRRAVVASGRPHGSDQHGHALCSRISHCRRTALLSSHDD